MSAKNTTLKDIHQAAHSNRKKRLAKLPQPAFARMFVFYVSLVLITGGMVTLGVMWYLFFVSSPEDGIAGDVPHTLIPTQQQVTVVVGGLSRSEALENMAAKRDTLGDETQNIVSFSLRHSALSDQQVGSEQLMEIVGPSAPQRLIRTIGDDFVYGIFVETNTPFLVLRVSPYEQALSGMFEWESGIAHDMEGVLYTKARDTANVRDILIDNKNARVLENARGRSVLAYMFFRQDTIGIAPSREALRDLFSIFKQSRR